VIEEARLEDVGSGLAPVSPGWFVVNAADAAWARNDAFGNRCVFESSDRVLQERPDLEPQWFDQIGFTLAALEPGKPSGMYHAESSQEDFLVLAGTCLLLIEDRGPPRGRHDRVPALGDGARPWRRRRDGDARPERGVCAVRALAAGPPGPALG
jgi:hypothetical protein